MSPTGIYYYVASDRCGHAGVFASAKQLGIDSKIEFLLWLDKHPVYLSEMAVSSIAVVECATFAEARRVAFIGSKHPFIVADVFHSNLCLMLEGGIKKKPGIRKAHRQDDIRESATHAISDGINDGAEEEAWEGKKGR